MNRPRLLALVVFLALPLASAAAEAPPPTPVTYHGFAHLPYKCHALPWSGPVSVDGLIEAGNLTRGFTADIFPRGFSPGTCPPPIYGFAGVLTPTPDPSFAAARVQLSLERCHLSPNLSTDLEPLDERLKPNDRPDIAQGQISTTGRFVTLSLEGGPALWQWQRTDHLEELGCPPDFWWVIGMVRAGKPKPPPPGLWDELPDLPTGPKIKSRGSSGKRGGEPSVAAAGPPPLLVRVQPCPVATLCLGRAGSGRADLLVRNVELFDLSRALAFVTLGADEVEVWRRLEGESDAAAVSWLFPALGGTKTANTGLLDEWDHGQTDFALRRSYRQAAMEALTAGFRVPGARAYG